MNASPPSVVDLPCADPFSQPSSPSHGLSSPERSSADKGLFQDEQSEISDEDSESDTMTCESDLEVNPTSDMISIYLEKPDIYQLRMYEMSGKVLLEKNIQREYQITFEGLERGVYFLELISKEDGSVLRDKILKQ